ncbi:hypothetical protein V2J09_002643 [Rumex salicifolius]
MADLGSSTLNWKTESSSLGDGGVDFLADERKKAQSSGHHEFEVSNRIACLVATDPDFNKDTRVLMETMEWFKNNLRKAAHAWEIITELRLSGIVCACYERTRYRRAAEKWLPMANKMQIIGCYAQTELGHGSNVQGLETTSTFDLETDEFVINSPTLNSSKWWPGGMEKYLLMQLFMHVGTDHGISGFIMQLRSLDDHLPLPGITIGEIGMKFGNAAYNSVDNEVLRFNNVRIPWDQMLMRVQQVTREGKVVQSNFPRQLGYGTMVYMRQVIVSNASTALSRAVCIATRYSVDRRQFGSENGHEIQAFPLLASACAFRFVSEWLKWLYTDVMQKLQAKDFSTLPEAHACTAGLKSLTTSFTSDAIDECRKLCGGHGYLCSSGLPELFAVYAPSCTYEGDNVVLFLQVGSFLMKTVSQLGSGKSRGLVEVFEARSAKMAVSCSKSVSKFPKTEEGEGIKQQLTVLCSVYALSILKKQSTQILILSPRSGPMQLGLLMRSTTRIIILGRYDGLEGSVY